MIEVRQLQPEALAQTTQIDVSEEGTTKVPVYCLAIDVRGLRLHSSSRPFSMRLLTM